MTRGDIFMLDFGVPYMLTKKAMFFFLKQYPNYQKIPLPLSTKSSQSINSGLEKKFQVSRKTRFLK